MPLGSLSMYPAAHPEVYPYYNPNWGSAEQQALLYNANQVTGGGPSMVGASPPPPTNNGDYQCRWLVGGILCGHRFTSFNDLMIHLGRVHDVRGSADRRLVCQWFARGYCGEEYLRNGFRRHISTHVGCRVHCTECGKSYSRSDSMVKHTKEKHGKE